jgi:hypothetical protein
MDKKNKEVREVIKGLERIQTKQKAVGLYLPKGYIYLDYTDKGMYKVIHCPNSGARKVLYNGGRQDTAKRKFKKFIKDTIKEGL